MSNLYLMEIIEWGADAEPETFGIIYSFPFTGQGFAEEVQSRGRPTQWPSVSKRYFYPSPTDASALGVPEDALLFLG